MKKLVFIFFSFYAGMPLLPAQTLGVPEAADAPEKVEVVETPVEITTPANKIQEIVPEVQLDFGEVYQSVYINVSDYSQIAFFVIPKGTKASQDPLTLQYRLDAFFSVNQDMTGIKDLDTKVTKFIYPGWQEFGSILSEETPQKPSFFKTSTGDVPSFVLNTPVLGPYVRVELKNRASGERQKFKIVAYLVR